MAKKIEQPNGDLSASQSGKHVIVMQPPVKRGFPEIPWKSAAGVIITLGTLAGMVIGPLLWVLGTVKDSNAEVRAEITTSKVEMKEALSTHSENPHTEAVPREIYSEHVKKADERYVESKAERKEILKKLDYIGRGRGGSDKKWKRVQDE